MKIKTVCELTGLTDRSVRYYIEEHLITPAYTENYLGRKSFDFSQEDIDTLKNISILRKFDFTIDEIRQIIEDASTSTDIIVNVKNRTAESISFCEEKLLVLSKLCNEQTYTLEKLAEELSTPTNKLPEHSELVKQNLAKTILSFIKSFLIFVIVWSPVALSLLVVITRFKNYQYPVFDNITIVLTIVSFWPSFGVLLISKVKWNWKRTAKKVLLILCVLSIPINFILSCGIITRSETTDIRNYRQLDVNCFANRNRFYQNLFPSWPHYFVYEEQPDGSWETVYLDAHYYYCKRPAMDYTYDIYAEWPLEKEEFDKEVSRVQALYENSTKEYDIVQRGKYTCFFAYDGDPPFEEVTDSYTYYIFAYNEENLVVRYIMCDSLENGADQPYYLTLEWK